ncbi:MAG: tRNA uridine-5-carboxymethylaminomethyl(34) synthesis GTPase MnmE [Rhodobacteraceae bacterium]|nr:tRNA uridine-5-carboxymethylaminomethyl(34) synthesis GTPase MnmE [Paracoccaceae bacterium]
MNTIFALASGVGRAGVSVIRVSGGDATRALTSFGCVVPAERYATVQKLLLPDGTVLDEAVTLFFKGPRSFTGEDTVELQCHGSLAVVRKVLAHLSEQDGFRLAEAGEFTRRALEHDRLDLTQVEGLSDLIEAETEAQRVQAQRVLSGAIGQKVEQWRTKLIRAAALIEATLDFADEEVPVDVSPEVTELLSSLVRDLEAEEGGVHHAEAVRRGFRIAILGEPNVGKSTLLNALAGREAAITSSIAGTTRDIIEVRLEIGGIPVTLLDTAGLRDSDDEIEAVGVARAMRAAAEADLRVFLSLDGSAPGEMCQVGDIIALAKQDEAGVYKNGVSGKTGAGLEWLEAQIFEVLEPRVSQVGIATLERHRIAIVSALTHLRAAQDLLGSSVGADDLVAEELRSAQRALEVLTGRIDVENLLSEIFSTFCLGK